MSTQRIYALPVELTQWKFDGATELQFNWEYDDGSAPLLELYEKGKQQQWDASTRLDWSLELNPDNPMELKDEAISIYGTDYWNKMTDKEASILKYLFRAGDRPVARDVLLNEVWGYNAGVTTHTLETHIYRLRQKIEKDPASAAILITDRGGYRLQP